MVEINGAVERTGEYARGLDKHAPGGEGSRGACKPAGPTRNGMSLLDVGDAINNSAESGAGAEESVSVGRCERK